MLRLLIVYGSTEGQTRRIAERMTTIAREAGHEVTALDSTALPGRLDLQAFDAVLVGASVHQGAHQEAVVAFAKQYRAVLAQKPSAFFSVSLEAAVAGEEHRDEAQKYVREFVEETGWEPGMTTAVAGALRFTEYDFLKRLMMKLISRREGLATRTSQDVEYTDWEGVRRFVGDFLRWAEARPEPTPPPPQPV